MIGRVCSDIELASIVILHPFNELCYFISKVAIETWILFCYYKIDIVVDK